MCAGQVRPEVSATRGAATVQVVTVEQGNLSSSLSVVGQLEAVRSADLAFEHVSDSAKLASLNTKARNTMTAEQVLARRLIPRGANKHWTRLRAPWRLRTRPGRT